MKSSAQRTMMTSPFALRFLQGGMGMAVGCNVGDNHAMFEPIHGSAPKYAGQDKVNPLAMIEALAWLSTRPKFAEQAPALSQAAVLGNRRFAVCCSRAESYELVSEEKASTGTQLSAGCVQGRAPPTCRPEAARVDGRGFLGYCQRLGQLAQWLVCNDAGRST